MDAEPADDAQGCLQDIHWSVSLVADCVLCCARCGGLAARGRRPGEFLSTLITTNHNPQNNKKKAGLFGYFPTYSLGAMYASQLYAFAKKELPTLDADVATGNFAALKRWLNARVHALGSLHPSGDALMAAVTGSELDPSIFLSYLRDKYTPLYKL